MKFQLSLLLLIPCLLLSSGCASFLVAQSSYGALKQKRAIEARALGESGAGIAIDVTALEALTYRPGWQVVAALADAATLYGGYYVVDQLNQNNSEDHSKSYQVDAKGDVYINDSGFQAGPVINPKGVQK